MMRTLFFAAATSILGARLHAAPPPVRPADCSFSKAVHELVQNMHVRVGFENLPGCTPGPRHQDRPNLTEASPPLGATATDALDRLLTTAPDFSWHSEGDVFVIRPTAAWQDATDPLNFRTTPFSVQRLDLDAALQTLIQHVEPSIYVPNTVIRRRVGSITLSFPGGTLLEALCALVGSGGLDRWEVAWMGVGVIVVQSHDFEGLSASAPIRHP